MPYKDKEIKKKKYKEWQQRNRDKINAYNRARYAANPTKQKAASRRWIVEHREQYNKRQREWMKATRARRYNPNTPEGAARLVRENKTKREHHLRLKIEVLTHYGHRKLRCTWRGCDVDDVDMLTLDHVNNDGAAHRKQLNNHGTGTHIYRTVKRNGFPKGFQTLCANHQLKKEAIRKRQQEIT